MLEKSASILWVPLDRWSAMCIEILHLCQTTILQTVTYQTILNSFRLLNEWCNNHITVTAYNWWCIHDRPIFENIPKNPEENSPFSLRPTVLNQSLFLLSFDLSDLWYQNILKRTSLLNWATECCLGFPQGETTPSPVDIHSNFKDNSVEEVSYISNTDVQYITEQQGVALPIITWFWSLRRCYQLNRLIMLPLSQISRRYHFHSRLSGW